MEKRFKDMGFDRVYKPGTPVEQDVSDLRLDLKMDDASEVGA